MFGFLKLGGSGPYGYSGSESYKHIDKLLNDDSSTLKIITPYLGIAYARMLLSLSSRKKIHIIVSGDQKKKDDGAVRLLIGKGSYVSIKLVAYATVLAIGFASLGMNTMVLVIAAITAIYIFTALKLLPMRKRVKVKIATDRFIHEKMYISERSAIVGSANLTYSGTHKNVEHIEVIRNEGKRRELSNHFDELWKRY